MSIQTGDTVTIRRGKLAGTVGEVIALNDKEAVLKLEDDTFSTQARTNVKAPDVPTINADDLAERFQVAADETLTNDGMHALYSLAGHLEKLIPNFRSLVPWPDEKDV